MTRKEAKQIISDIDKTYRNFTDDEYKALEMAISALTRESPCLLCKYVNEDTGLCDMCPAMPPYGAETEENHA